MGRSGSGLDQIFIDLLLNRAREYPLIRSPLRHQPFSSTDPDASAPPTPRALLLPASFPPPPATRQALALPPTLSGLVVARNRPPMAWTPPKF
jgi:hypothetical protein